MKAFYVGQPSHKISDEQQIYSIRNGWNYLFDLIIHENVGIDINTFNKLNDIVAKDCVLMKALSEAVHFCLRRVCLINVFIFWSPYQFVMPVGMSA